MLFLLWDLTPGARRWIQFLLLQAHYNRCCNSTVIKQPGMSKGQSIPLLSQVRWDTVSTLNTFPSLLKIWLLNKIMQTSSLEALQASCSSGPQCLLALQPFHRKLQEARCFPPCHHLLGDAFKLSLLCLVLAWAMLQPHLHLAMYPCWSWPMGLAFLHELSLVWWPELLTCLTFIFGVLWDMPLVSKLSPLPACPPQLLAHCPFQSSPALAAPQHTDQVSCLHCCWFWGGAGQGLFRCLCMPLFFREQASLLS